MKIMKRDKIIAALTRNDWNFLEECYTKRDVRKMKIILTKEEAKEFFNGNAERMLVKLKTQGLEYEIRNNELHLFFSQSQMPIEINADDTLEELENIIARLYVNSFFCYNFKGLAVDTLDDFLIACLVGLGYKVKKNNFYEVSL